MPDAAPTVLGFDHVQVTAPRAEEQRAKDFYGGVLDLPEIPKPTALAGRGGAWYQCGALQLHLGLEDDFHPQRKGHPAFLVRDLDAMRGRLEAAGMPVIVDAQIPGYRRFESRDPFGNRLEFLQRADGDTGGMASDDAADAAPAVGDAGEAVKARVRDAFGRAAAAYVTSQRHAAGADLARLVELAAPRPDDLALDISTGGGHTALTLAPHVAHVTASDLTPAMLAAARGHILGRGVTNVAFVVADAERLPFLDESFDLVTVRIAPHHYADVRAAVREMRRVLRSGGRLVLIDNIAPEDPAGDTAVNRWDAWRDPSHVREYTVSEWRAFLADAGLRIEVVELARKTYDFAEWVERMHMPDGERARLEADMLAAPAEVRQAFEVTARDGHIVSWAADFVIVRAVRPA
jgi:SAM-dependent methyltransferase